MKTLQRVLLFTGDGKGKTTAALGLAMRASGHGLRVLVAQFVKSGSEEGESVSAERLKGMLFRPLGRGFVPPLSSPSFKEHCEAALEGLEFVRNQLKSRAFDVVVLDEICVAVSKGLLQEDDVLRLLDECEGLSCVVLTGRNASERLMARADTVTEMKCLRHGYHEGISAQKGVEF